MFRYLQEVNTVVLIIIFAVIRATFLISKLSVVKSLPVRLFFVRQCICTVVCNFITAFIRHFYLVCFCVRIVVLIVRVYVLSRLLVAMSLAFSFFVFSFYCEDK